MTISYTDLFCYTNKQNILYIMLSNNKKSTSNFKVFIDNDIILNMLKFLLLAQLGTRLFRNVTFTTEQACFSTVQEEAHLSILLNDESVPQISSPRRASPPFPTFDVHSTSILCNITDHHVIESYSSLTSYTLTHHSHRNPH